MTLNEYLNPYRRRISVARRKVATTRAAYRQARGNLTRILQEGLVARIVPEEYDDANFDLDTAYAAFESALERLIFLYRTMALPRHSVLISADGTEYDVLKGEFDGNGQQPILLTVEHKDGHENIVCSPRNVSEGWELILASKERRCQHTLIKQKG